MAIDEVISRRRHHVAWLKGSPPNDFGRAYDAFIERRFAMSSCTEANLGEHEFLSSLAAVVLIQDASSPTEVSRILREHGAKLLDYDCRVLVRPAALQGTGEGANPLELIAQTAKRRKLQVVGLPAGLGSPNEISDGSPPLPYVRVFEPGFEWGEVADFVTMHPPGPGPNLGLKIDLGSGTLANDEQVLVRRAFSDCTEVHLRRLGDGKSGVPVYRAYPELAEGEIATGPLPYFLKLGDRRRVFLEYRKYLHQVDPYIPFHLGPQLVRERCCLGATKGLIVGDYVEESESLSSCARDGRAATSIACLFDRTLRGWHRGAQPVEVLLETVLKMPDRISAKRLELASALGEKRSLDDLRTLVPLKKSVKVFTGPIHGDLHAENVLVRATDAVVIDFLANKNGLLLRDPASLEVSLLVDFYDGPLNGDWLASVRDLYESRAFEETPAHRSPKEPSFWLRACLRQIRMHAKTMEREAGQYQVALANALLWKASKDDGIAEPHATRRAAAYVLAGQILDQVKGA